MEARKGKPGAFCGSEKLCVRLLHSSGMLSQPGMGKSHSSAVASLELTFLPIFGSISAGPGSSNLG